MDVVVYSILCYIYSCVYSWTVPCVSITVWYNSVMLIVRIGLSRPKFPPKMLIFKAQMALFALKFKTLFKPPDPFCCQICRRTRSESGHRCFQLVSYLYIYCEYLCTLIIYVAYGGMWSILCNSCRVFNVSFLNFLNTWVPQVEAVDACASTNFSKTTNYFIKLSSCDPDLRTSDLKWL